MKTPYDAALRLRRREMDEMSLAIGRQAGMLGEVEQAQDRASAAIRRETELAGDQPVLAAHGYFARKRAERRALSTEQAALRTRLEELRAEAVEVFGVYRAVETAAQDYREEAARARAGAEQAGIDDFAAAAFLSARRASAARGRP